MLVLPALTLEVSRYCFEVIVSYADTSLSDQSALSAAVSLVFCVFCAFINLSENISLQI